jgi:biopolymer transport protein ExbD
MNGHDLVPPQPSAVVSSELFDRIDAIARCLITHAARRTPTEFSERLREEWLADLSYQHGPMSRLRLALGCYWAAIIIKHDCCTVSTSTAGSSLWDRTVMTTVGRGMSPFSRETAAAGDGPALCEINTTPLIDILLVLLVTLIVSLPIMTHAVKLDLPQSQLPPAKIQPEVIDLDIDFDGAIIWNGSSVASFQQLEGYFRTESQKDPQPEIHLRPDPHAKYGVVARVLAAAQRNGMNKLGVVNSAAFGR